ncbi:MAG: hypothetical protein JNM02_04280, partial [Anaerolineales bacterium]|nr:hypothetical protein [Anaerolineales bacterium]
KQVTLQFEEFRITEEQAVEVQESKVVIRDMRLQPFGYAQGESSSLVWAEGTDKAVGVSRLELKQADEFFIYTTPASPIDLRKALEIVKPKTVYVFGIPPAEEKPEEFLAHLAGLCKFVLNQRSGNTSVPELAAAMAVRESAIQTGLHWLAASGELTIGIDEDSVSLFAQKQEKNPYLQAELFISLRGVINEMSAYRKYFATASDLSRLFN